MVIILMVDLLMVDLLMDIGKYSIVDICDY